MDQLTEQQRRAELRFEVKSYDVDFAQIASNIVYIRWLEDLRLELLNKYLPLADLLRSELVPVLASTCIRYKRPLRLFDKPVGSMRLTELGNSRWRLESEFSLDGSPVATADQTGMFVHAGTMRPASLPPELRSRLEGILRVIDRDT